mmetsp:Transcript_5257/g.17012  ORF Transcript_5257/g.17012 Transcript_5257/m.17012 type:complete len:218 (+) Transcript_5257:2468-3121(+)
MSAVSRPSLLSPNWLVAGAEADATADERTDRGAKRNTAAQPDPIEPLSRGAARTCQPPPGSKPLSTSPAVSTSAAVHVPTSWLGGGQRRGVRTKPLPTPVPLPWAASTPADDDDSSVPVCTDAVSGTSRPAAPLPTPRRAAAAAAAETRNRAASDPAGGVAGVELPPSPLPTMWLLATPRASGPRSRMQGGFAEEEATEESEGRRTTSTTVPTATVD